MAGMARLGEMRDGTWSIYDCLDAIEILDYRYECQAAAHKASMSKSKAGR